jgi:hypothetical protein
MADEIGGHGVRRAGDQQPRTGTRSVAHADHRSEHELRQLRVITNHVGATRTRDDRDIETPTSNLVESRREVPKQRVDIRRSGEGRR